MRFLIYITGLFFLLTSCHKEYNTKPYDDEEAKLREIWPASELKKILIKGDWEKRDSLTYLRFTNLEKIYLQTDSIPAWITRFEKVELIWLLSSDEDKGKVTSIPEDIGKLSNLYVLMLDNSNIQTIPPSFMDLKKLVVLNLNNNKLSSIPAGLGKLTNLEELSLDDNIIEEIPETLCHLKQLKYFSIENNKLTSFPECFGNMDSLETLVLNGNNIKKLPEWIFKSQTLSLVGIKGLPLDNPDEVYKQVEKMEDKNNRKKWEKERKERLAKRNNTN